jgi:pyruvate dehydrogenase E1 component alpha subunit
VSTLPAGTETTDVRFSDSLSREEQIRLLRKMLEIRMFEEEVQRLYERGLIRGSTHLCQGQEAVVVGACCAMSLGDTMTCTYRGHGAVLAMGAAIDRAFGELIGRGPGLCGGKGGSMHLTDVEVGAYGSFAIVGAHLPIAAGLAFAAQYRGTDRVSTCFFGDGATNIGAFHESLNLASIWSLPTIYICENNLYGEYSPLRTTTPIGRLADRAASYGMPGVQVDGNDLTAVMNTVATAIARARRGLGPTLIEALTYRHKGHSRADPATYRPAGELEAWLLRDPIELFKQQLRDEGVDEVTLEEVHSAARLEVDAAAARARAWPDPDETALLEDVWA